MSRRSPFWLAMCIVVGALLADPAFAGGDDLPDVPSTQNFVRFSNLEVDFGGLSISPAGDQDFVEFLAPADGSVNFEILFSDLAGDLDLSVYRSDLPLETFDAGAAIPYRLGVSASVTDDESVVVDLRAGQRVWMRAYGFAGATNNYAIRITVTTEPNNDLASATGLLGGSFSYEPLAIDSGTDTDWYRIVAPAGGRLTVDTFFTDSAGDLDLRLRNAAGSILQSSVSTTDNEQIIRDPVQRGEEFLVEVYGFSGATNDYALQIRTNERYTNDFTGGPGDALLFGDALLVGNALQLTDELGGQSSTATFPTFSGPIEAFNASFTYLFTRGSFNDPADGISFNMGAAPNATYAVGEDGPGQGLTVSFGLFDAGQGNAIVVFVDGVERARVDDVIDEFNDAGVPNAVAVDFDGTNITVRWNGTPVIDNVTVIQVFTQDTLNPRNRMGFAARTGGLNSRQVVDNVVIDAQVPEPGAALLGSAALATLGALRARARKRS